MTDKRKPEDSAAFADPEMDRAQVIRAEMEDALGELAEKRVAERIIHEGEIGWFVSDKGLQIASIVMAQELDTTGEEE